ncbi:DNA-dependent ATPase protein rad54 [Quaeritorhiza haematococci]|nr:DNA-dependent ATPase protein rad54 [Quaeritorhiza haematococci]
MTGRRGMALVAKKPRTDAVVSDVDDDDSWVEDDGDDEEVDENASKVGAGKRKKSSPRGNERSAFNPNNAQPTRLITPTIVKQVLKRPFKVPTFLNGATPSGGVRAGTTLGVTRRVNIARGPLHDPEAEDAIILYEPKQMSVSEQLSALSKTTLNPLNKPKQEVHVVVDPILGKVLRPHQVAGVRFLYDCVTGKKQENAFGCIMADEMAVIVCPSSLVRNWANELKKWLGPDRVRPLACDNKGSKEQTTKELEQFACSKGRCVVTPVLIISYESLRAYSPTLAKCEIGLMLCDEGHRLKNSESLTYQALSALNAKRRVILSGTPIQNDLSEYFALLNFAVPDVLGSEAEFRKNYENPILRGRDALASDKEREISEQKLHELLGIANKFIIRRTAELLTQYLPIKYEHVVFCKLTDAQLKLYRHFVQSKEIKRLLSGTGSQPLKAITMLKKLCNHPALLDPKDFDRGLFPENFQYGECQPAFGGKMLLLERLLTNMRKKTNDKIVLISNYTQTLDLFEKLCRSRTWGCLRLDGSMTIQKRAKLVDKFNDPTSPEFVFLLSSKAGGCGLNLIGANRLVLFDPDWNPANDGQALARVWRDGQKKTCFIYRFIATGSIEEKIFQSMFCPAFKGHQILKPPENTINAGATASDTSTWNHFSELEITKVYDDILPKR